uniref:Uncharacterized protein n=1 Tax=Centropages dorsispinatus TaxID=1239308 RepID=A0A0U2TI56_9MAXI|nr:hypothetical protein [Centropages dorsispinatus]
MSNVLTISILICLVITPMVSAFFTPFPWGPCENGVQTAETLECYVHARARKCLWPCIEEWEHIPWSKCDYTGNQTRVVEEELMMIQQRPCQGFVRIIL